MWKYTLTKIAISSISKLDINIQKRIFKKLDFFVSSGNPLVFAKKLTDSKLGMYRFRVGDYRIIFDVDEDGKIIIIGVVGKRGEIYK